MDGRTADRIVVNTTEAIDLNEGHGAKTTILREVIKDIRLDRNDAYRAIKGAGDTAHTTDNEVMAQLQRIRRRNAII